MLIVSSNYKEYTWATDTKVCVIMREHMNKRGTGQGFHHALHRVFLTLLRAKPLG